eukprot:scaffold54402_cov33-Attheya_sp.AAC.1
MRVNAGSAVMALQLCEDLVRKGSRGVVLDTCLSLCMAWHEHYASDDTPGGAIFWLLRGIECRSKMPVNTGVGTISSCDRKLRIMCASAAQRLVQSMVEQSSKVTQHVEVAHEIVKSIKEDETMTGKCGNMTEPIPSWIQNKWTRNKTMTTNVLGLSM